MNSEKFKLIALVLAYSLTARASLSLSTDFI